MRGYRVYRSTDGTSFALVETPSTPQFADSGLSPATCSYQVSAFDNFRVDRVERRRRRDRLHGLSRSAALATVAATSYADLGVGPAETHSYTVTAADAERNSITGGR